MDVQAGSFSTEVASGAKADTRAEDCHYVSVIGHVWTASFAYLLRRKCSDCQRVDRSHGDGCAGHEGDKRRLEPHFAPKFVNFNLKESSEKYKN